MTQSVPHRLRDLLLGDEDHVVDSLFERLSGAYERGLQRVVRRPAIMIVVTLLILGRAGFLFHLLPTEYSPREDRGDRPPRPPRDR